MTEAPTLNSLPKIILRNGRAMIEDGNGGLRPIDPDSDISLINELELRLPAEKMAKIKEAIIATPADDIIASTPLDLVGQRIKLKNLAISGDRAQASLRSLGWKTRQLGENSWDFAVSQDGKKWHLFDPTIGQQMKSGLPAPLGLSPIAETGIDFLELISDTVNAMGSGAAFTAGGGPTPLGIGAASATATGIDLVKQYIGEKAGIEQNVDVPDAVATGLVTGIFSGLTSGAAKVLKTAGGKIRSSPITASIKKHMEKAILQMQAGLAGVGGTHEVPAEKILKARVLDKAKMFQSIPGPGEKASALRRLVKMASRKDIPDGVIAGEMEEAASKAGVTGNLREIIDDVLVPMTDEPVTVPIVKSGKTVTTTTTSKEAEREVRRRTLDLMTDSESEVAKDIEETIGSRVRISRQAERVGETVKGRPRSFESAIDRIRTKEDVAGQIRELIDDLETALDVAGVDGTSVPIDKMAPIKKALQDRIDDANAFLDAAHVSGKKSPLHVSEYAKKLKAFQSAVRLHIAGRMDASGIQDASGRTYSHVMEEFARKSKQLSNWKYWMGAGIGDEEGTKIATQFLRNLHKTENIGFQRAADELKASTGIDVMAIAHRAMVSENFGESGVAGLFPRINISGEPIGSGLGRKALQLGTIASGGLLGFASGGVPGAIGGAAIGGAMSSEAGVLGAQRLGRNVLIPAASGAMDSAGAVLDNLATSSAMKRIAIAQSIAHTIQQRGNEDQIQLAPGAEEKLRRAKEAEKKAAQ